eukprot:m.263802 g.263802  ORF g.263802 m.263802 type:complete len:321 (+) comp15606_c0_seq1:3844-4806(+)
MLGAKQLLWKLTTQQKQFSGSCKTFAVAQLHLHRKSANGAVCPTLRRQYHLVSKPHVMSGVNPPSADMVPDVVMRSTKDHAKRLISWMNRRYGLTSLGYDNELVFFRLGEEDEAKIATAVAKSEEDGGVLPALEDVDAGFTTCFQHVDPTLVAKSALFTKLISDITQDETLSVLPHTLRIFPITHHIPAGKVADLIALLVPEAKVGVRLQAAPRKAEGQIIGPALQDELVLIPRWEECNSILSVIPWKDKWFLSMTTKPAFQPYFDMKTRVEAAAAPTVLPSEHSPTSHTCPCTATAARDTNNSFQCICICLQVTNVLHS